MIGRDKPVLLFAMGDGNHSLATAKAVWERMKPEVGLGHPARYALIELENVHDEGLDFRADPPCAVWAKKRPLRQPGIVFRLETFL